MLHYLPRTGSAHVAVRRLLMPWVLLSVTGSVATNVSLQECCLCVLRGGALKPTTTGRWAHLVCAVSIPEVFLEDSSRKEPVLASDIPRSRKKLVRQSSLVSTCVLSRNDCVQRCCMCQPVQATMTRGLGVCVQCVRDRCYSAFHVTCAQYRGLLTEECGERSGLVCHKHYMVQVSPLQPP